jgi:hypothetical protein
VKLRCYLLSLLRIHRPDCEHCKALEKCGLQMRERLAELNWQTQPNLTKKGVHGEVVPYFDSKLDEVVASPPNLSVQQMKKTVRASGAAANRDRGVNHSHRSA